MSPAGLAVDTALTCLILSLLVSRFTTAGVEQALRSGRLARIPGAGGLVALLPRGAWAPGLALGGAAACLAAPAAWGALHLLGVSRIPFAGFALFKAVYTALLGYAVTRLVVLRQVS